MKKKIIPFRIVLGLILAASIFGCHKFLSYENGSNNYTTPQNQYQATISGLKWEAIDTSIRVTFQNGGIFITGTSSDKKTLSITLNDTILGTYTLDSSTTSLASYADLNSNNANPFSTNQSPDTVQAGGKVMLTQVDTLNRTISGTFYFNLFRSMDGQTKVVTAGLFNKLSY
jgi:hypothetical protein